MDVKDVVEYLPDLFVVSRIKCTRPPSIERIEWWPENQVFRNVPEPCHELLEGCHIPSLMQAMNVGRQSFFPRGKLGCCWLSVEALIVESIISGCVGDFR
jgi:hypothetical protein